MSPEKFPEEEVGPIAGAIMVEVAPDLPTPEDKGEIPVIAPEISRLVVQETTREHLLTRQIEEANREVA